jgi:hypothetical protein
MTSSPLPTKQPPKYSLTNSPGFWERATKHARDRQERETEAIKQHAETDAKEIEELQRPKPQYYRPPPAYCRSESYDPNSPLQTAYDRSESLLKRRQQFRKNGEEKKKEAEAKEAEDCALSQWHYSESAFFDIGTSSKVKPPLLSSGHPDKRVKEPPIVLPPSSQNLEEFIQRQEKRIIEKHPSTPPQPFITERSRQILETPSKVMHVRRPPPDECTFQPDRSPAKRIHVVGLPVECVESHIILKNVRQAEMELERDAKEAAELVWTPNSADIKRRNRLATNSALRYQAKSSQESQETSHMEEEDLHAIIVRRSRKRLERNEDWKKKMHIMPYDRTKRNEDVQNW